MFSLIPFDDGHKPGGSQVQTRLAINQKPNEISNFLAIFDNLLSSQDCDRAYEYCNKRQKPWGVYIPTEVALNSAINVDDLWESDPQMAISLLTTRSLIFGRGKHILGGDALFSVHGTVVWCLTSSLSNSVEYHIDYAELYRYENHIIHPPILAGTCHLSPVADGDMEGGDFRANTRGLDHYKRFGYKGKLASAEDWEKDIVSSDWTTIRYKYNRGILHDGDLPHYSTPVTKLFDRRNNGDFLAKRTSSPKISTPTSATTDSPGQRLPLRRVILGFNCFSEAVAECCARAPEHSDAFNRTVRLYQAMAHVSGERSSKDTKYRGGGEVSTSGSDAGQVTDFNEPVAVGCTEREAESNASDQPNERRGPSPSPGVVKGTTEGLRSGKLTIADVKKNPALARLLVAAAKRIKQDQEERPTPGAVPAPDSSHS